MEYIREVKITVCIDTNKQTYIKSFDDIDEAIEYYKEIIEYF